MNKLIKKFTEQVGFDLYNEDQEKMFQEFADLVVRECVSRCEGVALKHHVEETIYAAGKKSGAFECALELKRHFGVK